MIRRSWVEINQKTIRDNYCIYRDLLPDGQKIMAVVKADAYGHGDTAVAAVLQKCGCRDFAVSNVHEAATLRKAGIEGQILILGYTPPECADTLVKYGITQALLDKAYAEEMADRGITAQFAIDTGMNRIGLDADDPSSCEELIRQYAKRFNLTGIFTHLCVADTPAENEFTDGQIRKFFEVSDRIRDLNLPYIHCLNSAGGLWHNENKRSAFARLGIILYGLKPDYANVLPAGIKPALEWKTVVAMVKKVHAGETVGYGRSWTSDGERTVATLPTGYADGYPRLLSNKGSVLVDGHRVPIVGRVCMDQMTVDVTGLENVKPGMTVTLIGGEYTADDMAEQIGTIGYEVLCGISKRVERIYLNEDTNQ